MEGLEELEKLGNEYPSEGDTLWAQYSERFSIIEKELKDYEEIKEIMQNHNCKDRFELNCKLCDYEEMLFDSEESKKKLKALNEIVALYDKWLGNEMSDFEFFTLLNDIKYKYGLENEILK